MNSFKLENELYTRYSYENSEPVNNSAHDFSGHWNRTNMPRASGGNIDISEIKKGYIFFSASLMSGGNSGMISGMAKIISNDEAIYIHNSKGIENDLEHIYIKFKIVDDLLEVESNDNLELGFGMNVMIDGAYTKDEPVYSNQDVVVDTFGTQERLMQMKNFLGEERWDFLEFVMEYGNSYSDENLTYSGFVSGAGQGADFLMTEEGKIYYLSYGEDAMNVFYTNDIAYKNQIPNFLIDRVRFFDDMKFIYKNAQEESVTDHYVWVKGYYEKPDSYNHSDTILWNQVEGSEWIEVTVNGAVQNLNLVTLKQNDAQDKLISDEILYHLDSVENQTVLVKATQSEGIPSEAITFEDENGNITYYYIEEKSLVGDSSMPNQQVFPLVSNVN